MVGQQIAVWFRGSGSGPIDQKWRIEVKSMYLGSVCERLRAAALISFGFTRVQLNRAHRSIAAINAGLKMITANATLSSE